MKASSRMNNLKVLPAYTEGAVPTYWAPKTVKIEHGNGRWQCVSLTDNKVHYEDAEKKPVEYYGWWLDWQRGAYHYVGKEEEEEEKE